jgi:hypothetical protein
MLTTSRWIWLLVKLHRLQLLLLPSTVSSGFSLMTN